MSERKLRGLEKVCKLCGRMKCGDVMMVWDYASDKAVPESEMPPAGSKRWRKSERIKWAHTAPALPLAPTCRL